MNSITIVRIVFDKETTSKPCCVEPESTTYNGHKKARYEGQETKTATVAYVTFSDGESDRYDVSIYPEWRTARIGDLVEKRFGRYIPLHRKP